MCVGELGRKSETLSRLSARAPSRSRPSSRRAQPRAFLIPPPADVREPPAAASGARRAGGAGRGPREGRADAARRAPSGAVSGCTWGPAWRRGGRAGPAQGDARAVRCMVGTSLAGVWGAVLCVREPRTRAGDAETVGVLLSEGAPSPSLPPLHPTSAPSICRARHHTLPVSRSLLYITHTPQTARPHPHQSRSPAPPPRPSAARKPAPPAVRLPTAAPRPPGPRPAGRLPSRPAGSQGPPRCRARPGGGL